MFGGDDDGGFLTFSNPDEPTPGGESPTFEMISFPAMDESSRPPPPPVDDFPLGCEVELLDLQRGKEAQTADFWDPIMDLLFQTVREQRKEVTVVRHSGDYTFVTLVVSNELTIGCHLYRACLREPKVKFRRYVDLVSEPDVPSGTPLSQEAVPIPTPSEGITRAFQKYTSKGNRCFRNKSYGDAVKYYTSAYQLNVLPSDKVRALANRSAGYLALRQYTPALDDALACLRYDPRDVAGYCRAGNVYRVIRQFERAEEMYSAALKLQPRNDQIRLMQASNHASAHFRAKTMTLSVEVSLTGMDTFVVTSRRDVLAHRTIFVEKPSYAVGIPSVGQATARGDSTWCSHCLKCLHPRTAVVNHLTSAAGKAFAEKNYRADAEVIPCLRGCPATYCSERCLTEAWNEYHCVECTSKGRWAAGVDGLDGWLRNSPLAKQSIALVFLAVRIMSKLAAAPRAAGVTLKEATMEILKFLPKAPSDPGFEMALLTPCYDELCKPMLQEEARGLNFVFFTRCFYVAKRCAVSFQCSDWSTFTSVVETHLDVISSGIHGPGEGVTKEALEEILSIDANQVPGVVNPCLGVFDILSLCEKKPNGPKPNVLISAISDITHSLQVKTVANTSKSSPLVTDSFLTK